MNILKNIKRHYNIRGGYKEFLKIAMPMCISMGVSSFQLFADRIFLSYYSQASYAASIPAGSCIVGLISLFLYTLAYVDVFVAQYCGKKEYRSIGPAVWQSVYLSVVAAFIILVFSLFTEQIFTNIGHPNAVALEEIKYFKTLCYGSFFAIATPALSGFYTGRSKTRIVLYVTACSVISNIILDFVLIFGKFGFPEMGITGAALATNISFVVTFITYVFLIVSKKNKNIYNTRQLRPDFTFMKRLLKYGFPNGVTVFFDIIAFGILMIIIGTIGVSELTASNIACSAYHIFFMPIVGGNIATSVIVGNYLGRNEASVAQTGVRSAFQIVYSYVAILVFVIMLLPNLLIAPFSFGAQAASIDTVGHMAVNILRLFVVYLIFDPAYNVFSSAIKGAGDTAFVAKRIIFASIFLMMIPTYLIVVVFKLGVYAAWIFAWVYSIFLASSCYLRYKSNKWKRMRVVEMDVIDG
ncbi:MAG: MATE family efflux transporter [Endomicrobium sp.]|nr:MATE family efflux transporter [Endomicrobium sp.]